MIVEGAKKGYQIGINKNDSKGIAACLDKIGKYTRADKEDDAIDWTEMIPPSMVVTDDVTVLNLEPIENLEEERKKFRALFKKNLISNAEDL